MSPEHRRSLRIQELTRMVKVLDNKGKTPEQIINAVRKRAYQMAAKKTAEEYVEEVIRRVKK